MKAIGLNNRASSSRNSRGGWIMIEMVAAVGILGILLTALGQIQYQLTKFNAIQWTRMRCITAGQGQLDSIAARGSPIADEEVERLWPGIHVQVERSAGQGDWQGLTLVKVTASGEVQDREIIVKLARYIAQRKEK